MMHLAAIVVGPSEAEKVAIVGRLLQICRQEDDDHHQQASWSHWTAAGPSWRGKKSTLLVATSYRRPKLIYTVEMNTDDDWSPGPGTSYG